MRLELRETFEEVEGLGFYDEARYQSSAANWALGWRRKYYRPRRRLWKP